MALQFDFNFFSQGRIVLSQDNQDFVTAEVINNFFVVGKGMAQFGSGKDDSVVFTVRAGSHGGHTVTFVAVEGPVNFQCFAKKGFAFFFRLRNNVKNFTTENA